MLTNTRYLNQDFFSERFCLLQLQLFAMILNSGEDLTTYVQRSAYCIEQ
jgi:hypothetical protein